MPAGRRTQVVKGAVCKTAMQRFDPARRLHSAHGAQSVWFIWFVWLNETNQMNQINQTDQTNQSNHSLPVSRRSILTGARFGEELIGRRFFLQIRFVGAEHRHLYLFIREGFVAGS
jgi:hypothetical protein